MYLKEALSGTEFEFELVIKLKSKVDWKGYPLILCCSMINGSDVLNAKKCVM